jgi:alpha-2-macroglobulin
VKIVKKITESVVFIGLVWVAFNAQAFQITSLSPQGEVAQVRQLVVKFDEAAVNFGDPKAAAPLTISCNDVSASQGSGRWVNEREWAFDFTRDLPPGLRCDVKLASALQSVKGIKLSGASSNSGYQFNTGGPFVSNILPSYGAIDEEQYFIAQFNGAATLASVQANMWCQVDGLGERVPVKLIDGKERADLLKSQGFEKPSAAEPLRFVTFACNRRLTPSAKLQVVFGKGVSTPSQVLNKVEKRFNFTVREPFTASFSCERENAQTACLPLRPLYLSFNTPVPRKLAEAIRLMSSKDSFSLSLRRIRMTRAQ